MPADILSHRKLYVNGPLRWLAAHELLCLLLAPLFLFPGPWTAVAAAAVVLLWVARLLTTGHLTLPTPMDGALVLLVVTALIGRAVSVDAAMSQAKFWGIFYQVALFYAVVNGLRGRQQILRFTGLLLGLIIVVAALSLVGTDWESARMLDLPALYERLPRLVRGLPGSGVPVASDLFHPREVGATLALLLPVPVALLLFGRNGPLRWLSLLAIVACALPLLLSESLQAGLGLAVALCLLAAWRSRRFLLALPAGLIALAGAVLAYGPQRAATSLLSMDHLLGVAVVLRWDIWSRAWAMVRDMPLTGVGLNTYPLVQTHFYPGVLLGPEPHAHSLFLQTAVDLGWPGVLALLWLLVAFYVTAIRAQRLTADRDLQVLLLGLATGVTAYVLHGLVDTVTLGAKPVAALFVMFGLAAAVYHLARCQQPVGPQAESTPARVPRRALRRGLVLGLLVVASLALPLLTNPAAPLVNAGMVRAHKALLAARTTGRPPSQDIEAALTTLRRAADRAPENVYVQERLGSLYAWQGDYGAALAAIERRVALDGGGREPLARYAAFEVARRALEPEGQAGPAPWEDLLWVYGQWNRRYPQRAEGYVLQAVVWAEHKGDAARARALLRAGLDAGAEPAGLLAYYASVLGSGR